MAAKANRRPSGMVVTGRNDGGHRSSRPLGRGRNTWLETPKRNGRLPRFYVVKRIFGQDVRRATENPPTLVRPPCIRSSARRRRLRPTVFAGGVPSATMIVIDARRALFPLRADLSLSYCTSCVRWKTDTSAHTYAHAHERYTRHRTSAGAKEKTKTNELCPVDTTAVVLDYRSTKSDVGSESVSSGEGGSPGSVCVRPRFRDLPHRVFFGSQYADRRFRPDFGQISPVKRQRPSDTASLFYRERLLIFVSIK